MPNDVSPQIEGRQQYNIALADFTSWRVGGNVKQLYQPKSLSDLSIFLQSLPSDEKILFLGLGSNVLIRDGGLAATVIITQGALMGLAAIDEQTIYAEAGVSCAQAARFSARQSLTGIEFLAGVPGTIGGALAMNAGCFGGETWEHVQSLQTINRQGEIQTRTPEMFDIAYREVKHDFDEWFISANFSLKAGDKTASLAKIREFLDRRHHTQPTNEPSCGSVFRNPPGNYSAKLIEACGLKGYSIGGAAVSTKHANFIINKGNATAQDIEDLINYVHSQVKEKHNIDLIREVHILGDLAI